MAGILGKLITQTTEGVALRLGWAERHFAAQAGRIRVLTYHGLVPDSLANRAWVPSHFVSVSRFERQMALLARWGPIRPLGEVLAEAPAGAPSGGPRVCLTFDDGTADNVTLALPILQRYGHRATLFLTTGHVGRGRLLLNDVIRLLSLLHRTGRLSGRASPVCRRLLAEPGLHKRFSAFICRQELDDLWERNAPAVDAEAIDSLRPMTWDEAGRLAEAGMEIGAHTVHHVILAREDDNTRQREIAESVACIRVRLAQDEVPFAYPNGLAEDYGELDLRLLSALRVPYAVTETPGWTDSTTPILQVRRNCIGLHDGDRAFLSRLFGFCDGQAPAPWRRSA